MELKILEALLISNKSRCSLKNSGLTHVPLKKLFNPLDTVLKNRKHGFVNKKGETYIEFIYEGAESFSEGLALVKYESKFGFITNNTSLKNQAAIVP